MILLERDVRSVEQGLQATILDDLLDHLLRVLAAQTGFDPRPRALDYGGDHLRVVGHIHTLQVQLRSVVHEHLVVNFTPLTALPQLGDEHLGQQIQ